MQAQAELFGQQLTFSSFIPTQPAPTEEVIQATEEINSETQREIMKEINEKQERITELRKEIGDAEDHIALVGEEELTLEPDEGDEDIFFAEAPLLEEDLIELRYENEEEIRSLEFEVTELEGKLA